MQITPLILILFFSGCSQKAPECKPEIIHVKTDVPRLKILYKVPKYKITDKIKIDDKYYKISIDQMHKASEVSQKRIHKIEFYEAQNMRFNREYALDD